MSTMKGGCAEYIFYETDSRSITTPEIDIDRRSICEYTIEMRLLMEVTKKKLIIQNTLRTYN